MHVPAPRYCSSFRKLVILFVLITEAVIVLWLGYIVFAVCSILLSKAVCSIISQSDISKTLWVQNADCRPGIILYITLTYLFVKVIYLFHLIMCHCQATIYSFSFSFSLFICHWELCISQSQQCPPPPPRANPRVLAFFKKNWANSPGWGRKKRANAPPPGSSPSNTFAVFLINQWIKRSTFQYFNAMVLKTLRTTLCASLFWLYLFLYILFSTKF